LCLGTSTTTFFICTIREPKLATLATNLEREYKIKTMGEEALKIEEDARKN
jgi:Na+/melibiose symporter-like transporter